MRIVEFGQGSLPVFHLSKSVERELKSGATYSGIDVDSKYANLGREKQAHLVLGDLRNVPLQGGVADEIWLLNVFSGRVVNPPERLPDGTLRYTLGLQRHFQEMTRILKPGGTIYIGEWYPRIAEVEWMKDESYEEYGLIKQVYEGENFQGFVKQKELYVWHTYKDTPPFFISLTKPLE